MRLARSANSCPSIPGMLMSVIRMETRSCPTSFLATEAEDIGFGWAQNYSEQISTKGSHGTDLPAVIKVCIARPNEKATYEADGANVDLYAGVKMIPARYLESRRLCAMTSHAYSLMFQAADPKVASRRYIPTRGCPAFCKSIALRPWRQGLPECIGLNHHLLKMIALRALKCADIETHPCRHVP